MESRLAAILAADVVGYSKLMGKDEAGTLSALTDLINEFIEPLIADHNGRIVKLMGDGVLAEFGSVVDAIACAVVWQGKIAEKTALLQFRIGVNLGEIIIQDKDIFGNGVNIAARLEGIATTGGICISDDVFRQVKGKVDCAFTDIGEQQLKNVDDPIRVYRVAKKTSTQLGDCGNNNEKSLALPDKPSLAVLPFTNMSGDPEQEYFADGIAEDLITAFSRIKWLFVIARNSSFTYKGRAVDIKQVGRELGVHYVLEGSVRRAGNRLRITGQLIDATTGGHLWADRFDGEVTDIFDLQDRVTQSVVGTITPRLENAEINRTRHKPTESLDAYDNYLRGMAEFHQFTQDANKRAVELFTLAYQLDPEYAAAFGMAARTYGQRKGFGWITDHAIEKGEALRLARMATKYGRDDAIALAGAGFALSVFNEANDSDAFLGQALDINPNLAWAWHTRGMSKAILGHPELSVEYSVHALRLSPQDPQQFAMHGICSLGYYLLGRDNEAYLSSDAALRNNPNFLIALAVSAASNAMLGNVENANKAMAHFCTLDPVRCVSNLDQWLDFRRTEDRQRWRDGLILAGLPE